MLQLPFSPTNKADLFIRADALRAFGVIATSRGQLHQAKRAINEALNIACNESDSKLTATLLQKLSNISALSGAHEEAYDLIEEAASYADKDDANFQFILEGSKLCISIDLKNWAMAETTAKNFKNFQNFQINKTSKIAVSNNLCIIYINTHRFQKAIELAKETIQLSIQYEFYKGIVYGKLNLGIAHRLLGNHREGRRPIFEAFELAKSRNDILAVTMCIKELGHLAYEEGRYERSAYMVTTAETLRLTLGLAPLEREELLLITRALQAKLTPEQIQPLLEVAPSLDVAAVYADAIRVVSEYRTTIESMEN